jgi:hypothetical protein
VRRSGWARDELAEQYAPDRLPPMRVGFAGNDIRQYLHRRPLWNKLRQDYEAKGEKLVPYSCRHGYAHRAHVICDLAAYSRWCGDDVVDDASAFTNARIKSGPARRVAQGPVPRFRLDR